MISIKQKQVALLLVGMTACLIFHLFWIVPWAFAENNIELSDQIRIKVNANNYVNADRILLDDIAVIFANPFLLETIKNIEVGASPKPEKIIVIDKRKIVFQLKQKKYLPQNLMLTCPEKIFVKRSGQLVSKQQIESFIHHQLEKSFFDKPYELKQLNIRGLEPYSKGKISFDIDTENIVNRNGRLSCYLDVLVNDVKSDRLSVSGTVAVYENVVFAARSLSKGDSLSKDDVYIKKVNIFDFNPSVIHTLDVIGDKILKSSIRKDMSMTLSLLSDPPLVKKGDIIMLIAKNQNLRIVTSGISMEDGFINELIKVENFHSGKLIRGIVTEESKVEVVY